jgi:murein DD-endopeptidase MepM/ murein hydrolase activator NlpD
MGAGCPRCQDAVALHEGRPFVTISGAVELWHARCWERRAEPIVVSKPMATIAIIAPPSRSIPKRIAAGAAATALLAGAIAYLSHSSPSTAAVVNVDPDATEALPIRSTISTHDHVPPAPAVVTLAERFPMPTRLGVPLDETFTSLQGWIHPVTNSPELMPERFSRRFGSERVGIERPECGAGHCGVDLDGPRGRPIVAVADGTIIRVERKELGSDGRSGRYVRIQHDDGAITAYMHMDDVAEALQVRDRVTAGQYVGTLGATAVFSAPPHLHFSLELPEHAGDRGDGIATTYVDPAPFLVRATIANTPERKHAVKPAF